MKRNHLPWNRSKMHHRPPVMRHIQFQCVIAMAWRGGWWEFSWILETLTVTFKSRQNFSSRAWGSSFFAMQWFLAHFYSHHFYHASLLINLLKSLIKSEICRLKSLILNYKRLCPCVCPVMLCHMIILLQGLIKTFKYLQPVQCGTDLYI